MDEQQEHLLETLYLQLYERLFVYARSCLDSAELAEEAVQETFRIACDKLSVLLESENPQGWLVNTLKGVLRNFFRKDVRDSRVFVPYPEEYDCEHSDELPPELLYQDLAGTKEYDLLMKLSEAGTVRELAKRLQISESACKKRVQRARAYLKKKITK